MTRITLIGPVYPYRGGIAHFTSQLAEKLQSEGVELQVVSFRSQYPRWLYPGKSDQDASEGRLKIDAAFSLAPLNPLTWLKTIRLIRRFRPDLVIFPWWVTFWAPAFLVLASALKAFRKTLIIHNVLPHEPRFFDPWLTRVVFSKVDSFLLMSDREKQRLVELRPDAVDAPVVPLPVLSVFTPTEVSKEQARKRLGIPEDDAPLLVFFGIVRPYKGLEDLIRAVGLLHERGRATRLLVAGEIWEDRQHYDTLRNALGIADHVSFTDRYVPDNEVSLVFKAADLFVAPYRSGTQSAAIAAALGFGVPIVLTDVIADPLTRSLTDLCEIVPAARPDLLATAIENSLNRGSPEAVRINEIAARSWTDLTDVLLRTAKRPENA